MIIISLIFNTLYNIRKKANDHGYNLKINIKILASYI